MDVEALISRIRQEAATRGADWVSGQFSALDSAPAPAAASARARRPPDRLSPDASPRAQRQNGSPIRDPPAPPAKRKKHSGKQGAGRNPQQRRSSSGKAPTHTSPRAQPASSSASPAAAPKKGNRPAQRGSNSRAGASTRSKTAATPGGPAQLSGPSSAGQPGPSAAATTGQASSSGQAAQPAVRGTTAAHPELASPSPTPPRISGKKATQKSSGHRPGEESAGSPPRGVAGVSPRQSSSSSSEAEVSDGDHPDGSGASAGLGSSSVQPDALPCLVWILGHSYVAWGARRAGARPEGRQLGIPRAQARVRWIGFPGMVWARVVPEVHRFARLDRPPDILVIHAGGNDLASYSTRRIIRDIKFDFLRLRTSFPATIVVWSEVVGRQKWRQARSVDRVNRARKKLNREVSRFVVRNGGVAVRHVDLELDTSRFLRMDGVHLNAVGTDLWTLALSEGIQRALRLWWAAQA
ncbi:uncharacterized protein [Hyperolius riggenbachi]|uniref:uncharacterized protein n=1 Tax=Hyperolius riggenbachi TaxID=752182 RepID=UPI0035A2CD19